MTQPQPKPYSQIAREWRASLGMTQVQAADAIGVSSRTIKSWEGGFTVVPRHVRLAMSAIAANLPPYQ